MIIRKFFVFIFSILITIPAFSQNLLNERIRKISDRKKSVYLSKGIIHLGEGAANTQVQAVRHRYTTSTGYERIVFDFNGNEPAKVYGYISPQQNKLYLDFFKTRVNPEIGSFGASKFVKRLNFFNFGEDSLTAEIEFKGKKSIDVFALSNPGRIVVDIK